MKTLKITLISTLALFLVLFLLFGMLLHFENSGPNKTTHTFSKEFAIQEEKIAFLRKYTHYNTEALEVGYLINYHDNASGMPPGPSDWNYYIAYRFDSVYFDKLQQKLDCQVKDSLNLDVWKKILPDKDRWKLSGPKLRCKYGVILVLEQRIALNIESGH